jgi:hypothetical protein
MKVKNMSKKDIIYFIGCVILALIITSINDIDITGIMEAYRGM